MTSEKDDWETPQALFDRLDAVYHFTLDPASSHKNAKCAKHFTEQENGLLCSWENEVVFCNPPYGRTLGRWVEKAATEAKHATVVLLIPARTDTKYFHNYIYKKPNVRIEFLQGRLKFERGGVPLSSAPFPSMLVFFNEDANRKSDGTATERLFRDSRRNNAPELQ